MAHVSPCGPVKSAPSITVQQSCISPVYINVTKPRLEEQTSPVPNCKMIITINLLLFNMRNMTKIEAAWKRSITTRSEYAERYLAVHVQRPSQIWKSNFEHVYYGCHCLFRPQIDPPHQEQLSWCPELLLWCPSILLRYKHVPHRITHLIEWAI